MVKLSNEPIKVKAEDLNNHFYTIYKDDQLEYT
jgi:hypothetical protein